MGEELFVGVCVEGFGIFGAVISIVTTWVPYALQFPIASFARTCSVLFPSDKFVAVNEFSIWVPCDTEFNTTSYSKTSSFASQDHVGFISLVGVLEFGIGIFGAIVSITITWEPYSL